MSTTLFKGELGHWDGVRIHEPLLKEAPLTDAERLSNALLYGDQYGERIPIPSAVARKVWSEALFREVKRESRLFNALLAKKS